MTMPEPMTPPDCDLKRFKFDYMPLHVNQLRDSDFTATVSDAAFRAGVLLWAASWHQLPAASIPDDDRVIAGLAGFGRFVDQWRLVRDEALHGWVKCSDGRLYHPKVAEQANKAWASLQKGRERTAAARAAAAAKQNADAGERSNSGDEQQPQKQKPPVTDARHGQSQGGYRDRTEMEKEESNNPQAPSPDSSARGLDQAGVALWESRCDQIIKTLGEKCDAASPMLRIYAPLLRLAQGQADDPPCDWDHDIFPAIVELSARMHTRLASLKHPGIADVARRNRDRRLNPESEDGRTKRPRAAGSAPRGLAGAALSRRNKKGG